jgi:hypothetical protein
VDKAEVKFEDNRIEDPLVYLPARGDYILRLSVSDDSPVENEDPNDIGSDTVNITVLGQE